MYLIRNCCGFTLTLSIIIGRCFVLRESDQNRSVRLAKTLILYIHIASFTSVIKRWLASKSKIRIRFELFNRLTIYMIFESTVKNANKSQSKSCKPVHVSPNFWSGVYVLQVHHWVQLLYLRTQFDALQQLIAAIGPLTPGYCNALTSYQTRRYHRTINQLQESSIQITISSIWFLMALSLVRN